MAEQVRGTEGSSAPLQKRMDAMFAGDRAWAAVMVVGLWVTVLFVMFAVRGFMGDPAIEIVCWIGAALLLLFNTASIVAMVRHYARDKAHIYGVDIRHLDAGR